MNSLAKYAVVYRDEGPKGISGQSMSITREWTKVHLFHAEEEALKWIGRHPIVNGSRKNAYYVVCGEGYPDSIEVFNLKDTTKEEVPSE